MLITVRDKKTKDVYMAAGTTETVCDMTDEDKLLDNNIALWKVPNRENTYIGCTSLSHGVDVLRYVDIFDGIDELDGYAVMTKVAPRVREILTKLGEIDDEGYWIASLTIVDNGNIFVIDSMQCADEVDEDFYVKGYGSNNMKGTLEATQDSDMTALERIVECTEFLDRMSCNRSLPLVVINTRTGERHNIFSYNKSRGYAK